MKNLDKLDELKKELKAAAGSPEEAAADQTQNQEQDPNTQPEENGGKMFTQEEVNKIVSDRLARERAKNGNGNKENELKKREDMVAYREYLNEKGMPVEILGLLASVDLETMDGFKDTLEKFFIVIDMLQAKSEGAEHEKNEEEVIDLLKRIFGKEGEEAYYGD